MKIKIKVDGYEEWNDFPCTEGIFKEVYNLLRDIHAVDKIVLHYDGCKLRFTRDD